MAHSGPKRTSAVIALAAFAITACQSTDTDKVATPSEVMDISSPGGTLAETLCSACHAVTRTDASPHPEAPPLRHLSDKYPVRHLEEALAEGIFVGHPDMPAFQLQPDEIDALLDYLESIQV
jgi:mono/diheme cytochrome c family protein